MRHFLVTISIIYLLMVFILIVVKCIRRLQKKSEDEMKEKKSEREALVQSETEKAMPMKEKTKYSKKAEKKISKVMKEWGGSERPSKLHSGSKTGPIVKSQKQAIAIGISEARKKGERVPAKKK